MKMNFRRLMSCLAVLGLLLTQPAFGSAQEKEDASEAKQEVSIKGEWVVKSGTRSGDKVGDDRLPPSVEVTDKVFKIPGPDGGEGFVMAYKLNTEHSPYHIDFEITEGPAQGNAIGICKVDGDKMVLCYDPTGTTRPEDFKTTEENGCFMFVLNKKATKLDPAKLVGDWQCVEGVRAGEELGEDRLPPVVKVTKEDFTIPVGPDMKFVMSYTIDTDSTPAKIDMKIEEGPGDGNAVGIIEIKDGVLRLCYDSTGENRPESFDSDSENGFFFFTLEQIVD